jgi:16S rRNA (adenine1518-N6/adenine1519-N6)-dimethyltransferase
MNYSNNNRYPAKKKAFGQHFLRKQSVVDNMIDKVVVTDKTSILEIGTGDGFLTQSILAQTKCKQLRAYEIDPEWAAVIKHRIKDPRLDLRLANFLDADFSDFEEHKPWIVLANLPYQVTFPIIFLFQKHKALFTEGVIMVQEEVAQKIVAKRGRSYNPTSIFLQYHFDWELLEKIEPQAFEPAPKIFSRLLYFKPKFDLINIPREEEFWKFLKLCFRTPRQTLKNNLKTTHYLKSSVFSEEMLQLRAQQMSFDQFLQLWNQLI